MFNKGCARVHTPSADTEPAVLHPKPSAIPGPVAVKYFQQEKETRARRRWFMEDSTMKHQQLSVNFEKLQQNLDAARTFVLDELDRDVKATLKRIDAHIEALQVSQQQQYCSDCLLSGQSNGMLAEISACSSFTADVSERDWAKALVDSLDALATVLLNTLVFVGNASVVVDTDAKQKALDGIDAIRTSIENVSTDYACQIARDHGRNKDFEGLLLSTVWIPDVLDHRSFQAFDVSNDATRMAFCNGAGDITLVRMPECSVECKFHPKCSFSQNIAQLCFAKVCGENWLLVLPYYGMILMEFTMAGKLGRTIQCLKYISDRVHSMCAFGENIILCSLAEIAVISLESENLVTLIDRKHYLLKGLYFTKVRVFENGQTIAVSCGVNSIMCFTLRGEHVKTVREVANLKDFVCTNTGAIFATTENLGIFVLSNTTSENFKLQEDLIGVFVGAAGNVVFVARPLQWSHNKHCLNGGGNGVIIQMFC